MHTTAAPRTCANAAHTNAGPRLLDLCTGSGAVAIAIKHVRPDLDVSASDISPAALSVARENARRLVNGNISFYEGDLFDLSHAPDSDIALPQFSLITANPPYVPAADIAGLSREVQREPLLALDGGADGLELIRRIVREAPAHLDAGGSLLIEADSSQMTAISGLMCECGFTEIAIKLDLAGRSRVICGRKQ
jgi:release factor glutamine methyltransferase